MWVRIHVDFIDKTCYIYLQFGITLHDSNQETAGPRGSTELQRKTSATSSLSGRSLVLRRMTTIDDCGSKFPKLEECAHFHYDFVELGPVSVSCFIRLLDIGI